MTKAQKHIAEFRTTFLEEWEDFCNHILFTQRNLDAKAIRFMNELPDKLYNLEVDCPE